MSPGFFVFSQFEVSDGQVIMSLAITRVPFQRLGKAPDRRFVLQTIERDQSQTKMRLCEETIFAERGFIRLTSFFHLTELLVRQPFLKSLFGGQSFNRSETARDRIGRKDGVRMAAVRALDVFTQQGAVGGVNFERQRPARGLRFYFNPLAEYLLG